MSLIKRMKGALPGLLVCAAAFYLLPLAARDTGAFMVILLGLMPVVCFLTALVSGRKRGFYILYALLVGGLFATTVPIFYNTSALIYCAVYFAAAFVGNLLGGYLFFRSRV
jgi:hypothetical protein